MMKNNKFIIPVIGAVVVVLVLGVVFFVMSSNKNAQNTPATANTDQPVKTIKAEDIGLKLEGKARPDGKAINLTISKLDGIKSVEYEVTYDAEETAEGETAVVPKGVTNSPIEVKSGDKEITREVYLGTCSRNICRPDKVKSDIKFVFKVTFSDGSLGSLEETVSLDSL